jgi:hypothetical protein
MFKATKSTVTAMAVIAAAVAATVAPASARPFNLNAHGTIVLQPPPSGQATTRSRPSPPVNPCSGVCSGRGESSLSDSSWQQIERDAAVAQLVAQPASPAAPRRAAVVAPCIPIPRGVCLPSASVQPRGASVHSVRPAAPSAPQGLKWDDAAIVGGGTLLLLGGGGAAAVVSRRRQHRAAAS